MTQQNLLLTMIHKKKVKQYLIPRNAIDNGQLIALHQLSNTVLSDEHPLGQFLTEGKDCDHTWFQDSNWLNYRVHTMMFPVEGQTYFTFYIKESKNYERQQLSTC